MSLQEISRHKIYWEGKTFYHSGFLCGYLGYSPYEFKYPEHYLDIKDNRTGKSAEYIEKEEVKKCIFNLSKGYSTHKITEEQMEYYSKLFEFLEKDN